MLNKKGEGTFSEVLKAQSIKSGRSPRAGLGRATARTRKKATRLGLQIFLHGKSILIGSDTALPSCAERTG